VAWAAFVEKNLRARLPDWSAVGHRRATDYPLVDDEAVLVWLAQSFERTRRRRVDRATGEPWLRSASTRRRAAFALARAEVALAAATCWPRTPRHGAVTSGSKGRAARRPASSGEAARNGRAAARSQAASPGHTPGT
jgi:hypothetical protein